VVWVLVFGGIALAGLVMLVCYAIWLIHKASDVMSEVRVLISRGDQLAAIVGQIGVPQQTRFADLDSQRTLRGDLANELTT
jgi:hypothetical protein